MTKKYETCVEVADVWEAEQEALAPSIGTLRIAKVVYEHRPIRTGGTATVGQLIDEYVSNIVRDGGLVSEVTLTFETIEQQEALAAIYM